MDELELSRQPEKLFSLLSDITRLRCLFLMHKKGEVCVCELAYALDISQPKISRHLALLRNSAIVTTRKNGLWVYYQINPELEPWIQQVLTTSLNSITTVPPYYSDLDKLEDNEKVKQICNVSQTYPFK